MRDKSILWIDEWLTEDFLKNHERIGQFFGGVAEGLMSGRMISFYAGILISGSFSIIMSLAQATGWSYLITPLAAISVFRGGFWLFRSTAYGDTIYEIFAQKGRDGDFHATGTRPEYWVDTVQENAELTRNIAKALLYTILALLLLILSGNVDFFIKIFLQ